MLSVLGWLWRGTGNQFVGFYGCSNAVGRRRAGMGCFFFAFLHCMVFFI